MSITPHSLGVHKILKHIPLNVIFDAPAKRRLAKAVNIADLRLCAKARAHKVRRYLRVSSSSCFVDVTLDLYTDIYMSVFLVGVALFFFGFLMFIVRFCCCVDDDLLDATFFFVM